MTVVYTLRRLSYVGILFREGFRNLERSGMYDAIFP
jgi:hypothetical protein